MTHRGEEEGSGPWLRGAACAGDEEEDDMRLSRSSAAAADSASFAKCYSFSQREQNVTVFHSGSKMLQFFTAGGLCENIRLDGPARRFPD